MINATESFLKQIENFLMLLTQKERVVIERRYNLDNKERATLEEIGQKFSVTRERIRQIEKNALNKLRRNLENTNLIQISNLAYELIQKSGGILKEDDLLSKLLNLKTDTKTESLQLVMSIDKRYVRIPNTVNFYPYVRMNNISEAFVDKTNKDIISLLKKSKDTLSVDNIIRSIGFDNTVDYSRDTLISALLVNKSIIFVNEEVVGLTDWRHINPRTLRDKIFFVLRKDKKPLHFVEIANKIIEFNFDKKKINLQAVHNELIRHPDFVLIGRGIYGLKEWGYAAGTVAEVIAKILKDKGSLNQEEIVKEVLKQRQVKPITVILSLKNKDQFVRVGRKQYSLNNA